MNITLSVDEKVLRKARVRADRLGKSLNQLVREYIEQLAGKSDPEDDAAEFERLSEISQGHSQGWRFDREELHERQ